MGNEIGFEGLILDTLCYGLRAFDQIAGANAGKSTKPGQLNLVIAKRRDRRCIRLHGNIFNIDSELLGQIYGNFIKS